MKHLVCVVFLVISSKADEECSTKDGDLGVCKGAMDCPYLSQIFKTTPVTIVLEKFGGCGRVNGNIQLCCPDSSESTNQDTTFGDRTTSALQNESAKNTVDLLCPPPYRPVGGRCLFFHSTETSQYWDMRNLCRSLGGDLVQIDDANLHANIVEFIREEGLTPEKFWIGANDLETEGIWKWPDGSLVRMGTPSWGYLTEPELIYEPGGGHPDENCGCLIKYWLYFFHDCLCDEHNSAICEYISGTKKGVAPLLINFRKDDV